MFGFIYSLIGRFLVYVGQILEIYSPKISWFILTVGMIFTIKSLQRDCIAFNLGKEETEKEIQKTNLIIKDLWECRWCWHRYHRILHLHHSRGQSYPIRMPTDLQEP